MAYATHDFYNSAAVATVAATVVDANLTLAGIANREASKVLVPGTGASVTVKRPNVVDPARVYSAENRAAGDAITYSSLVTPYTSLTVTDQVYNAVGLTDFDATFTIEDLERDVVAPMAETVADGLDNIVAGVLAAVPAGLSAADKAAKGKVIGTDGKTYADVAALKAAGVKFAAFGSGATVKAAALTAADHDGVLPAIRAARQLLQQRGIPAQGRYLVVGSGWEAALISQDILTKVNESGSDSQLRQAIIGNLYGFTVVASPLVGTYDAFALGKDAVTLATALTATPRGAAYADTASARGTLVRYIHDYDADHITDRAIVDVFAGGAVLDGQRIVRLTGAEGIEEKAAGSVAGVPGA